jgi:ABC-type branched-subunit amino acid transport system substrate-binding protein
VRFVVAAARVVAATVALVMISGCGGEPPPPPRAALEPIRVAIINPQTGDFSSLGQWEHKGVKLAVDEANATGGVHGRLIELSVFDDEGVAARAAELAQKVGAGGYVAILGSALSGNTLAMAPNLARQRIPAITSGQAPSLAALGNPYVFLNSATSTTFDETLAAYVIDKTDLRTIAMITNEGAYGRGERAAFTASLAARGIAPVADRQVAVGQKDFAQALTAIRQTNPDALFIGAEEIQSGLIVQQARSLGITATLLGGAPMGTDVFLNTAGVEAVEGAIFATPYPTNDENDATREFAAAYQAAYGEAAEYHGAKAYDGARILIEALRASDVATGLDLADAIRAVRFRGLLGEFAFDTTGVGIHQTRVATVKAGKVVALAT